MPCQPAGRGGFDFDLVRRQATPRRLLLTFGEQKVV